MTEVNFNAHHFNRSFRMNKKKFMECRRDIGIWFGIIPNETQMQMNSRHYGSKLGWNNKWVSLCISMRGTIMIYDYKQCIRNFIVPYPYIPY